MLDQINAAQQGGRILQRRWNQVAVLFHGIVQCIRNVITERRTAAMQYTVQNNNIRIKGIQQIIDANRHIDNKIVHQTSGIRITIAVKCFEHICMNRHVFDS